ncbi:hypothetical protein ACS0TY_019911 [Phlomoides rotata]
MDKSSSKTVDVTVISAENLLVNKKRPVKKTVSVTVKTDPYNSGSTGLDREGGSFPKWNEKLVMELPANARFVAVEVHSGSRVVAMASVPVSDFTGGNLPENYLSLLSYRLRDGRGGKNGIINLSVKVRGTGGNSGCAASISRPWMGVPAANNKVSDAIVMGIPVSYRY